MKKIKTVLVGVRLKKNKLSLPPPKCHDVSGDSLCGISSCQADDVPLESAWIAAPAETIYYR